MRGGATFTTVMNNAAEVLTRAQEAGSVRRDLRPRDLLLLGRGVGVAAEGDDETAERLIAVMLHGLRA
ncbi:hypothetical protein GCM10027445_08820 [Amycolatopsis endophytica]|uniref:Transcriptional regulator SbtR-like C-terminal domain-containing protein n=1 Tax=Amycolatopsis endophytica TaxID=860233 RepID=A0A853AWQ2_9PSEU|nr:hypothetical protein [Amycolatopsis endophytica]NYI87120.1 hypothetical protein [Amycolatopsis endophytica]